MTAAAAAPTSTDPVVPATPGTAPVVAVGAEKVVPPAVDPAKGAEPTKPPEKVEPPKEPVGAAFARLARAEKARVAKEQAAKAEIDAERVKIAAERAEVEKIREEAKAIREAEARAKADPSGYLERLYGKDWYEKLTEVRLAGGKATPDLALRAVEEKIEGRLTDFERRQEEARKADVAERQKAAEAERERIAAEQKAIVEQFHEETIGFVQAHPEEYELTNLYDGGDLVVEVIKETFQKTKRVLSAKEAAEQVERYFEEQVEKAGQTKKLGPKFAKPAAPKTEEPPKVAPTLSNATAAAPSFAGPPKNEEERIARAIAAYEAAHAKTRTA